MELDAASAPLAPSEINRILAKPDTNHSILGIRRIGKTSLLREVERILKEGEDPNAHETMKLSYQHLPDRLFGVMPKSMLHYFMDPFLNNLGVVLINTAKYISALRDHTFRESHAEFHFLLDYVPNWERSFGRGGLIQYQSFLPRETAEDAWREMLQLSHRRGLPSYLGVTKRHRPDKFLLTRAVDGFSLAMD